MLMTILQKERVLSRHLSVICDNFAADGRVYFRINEVRIELYSDSKDVGLESKVEAVLDSHGIFYNKSEVWIQSEKLYEILYSFEV